MSVKLKAIRGNGKGMSDAVIELATKIEAEGNVIISITRNILKYNVEESVWPQYDEEYVIFYRTKD